MILPILKYGKPELKRLSLPVDHFDGELEKLVKNMIETMYSAPGIGLAAEIVSTEGEQKSEEGCLSIPDFTDTVIRPKKMIVRGQDIHGEEVVIEAEGLLARCFSHEIDHLNGILYIDHLSTIKKSLIRSKIKKLAKSGNW